MRVPPAAFRVSSSARSVTGTVIRLYGPHSALFGVLFEQPNKQSIGSGRHPALAIAIDKVALLLSRGRAAVVRLITI
jgi:hypothetical protein